MGEQPIAQGPAGVVSEHGSYALTESGGTRITVCVEPAFLPGESAPEPGEGRAPIYLFMYEVTITNDASSAHTVQVMSRHWVIVDADGERREVRGSGVVGKQPTLAPGETFTYASSCPLSTPWGTMEGTYRFVREDGTPLDAKVARFFLVSDGAGQPTQSVGDGL